jgi:hypothetical protein
MCHCWHMRGPASFLGHGVKDETDPSGIKDNVSGGVTERVA